MKLSNGQSLLKEAQRIALMFDGNKEAKYHIYEEVANTLYREVIELQSEIQELKNKVEYWKESNANCAKVITEITDRSKIKRIYFKPGYGIASTIEGE